MTKARASRRLVPATGGIWGQALRGTALGLLVGAGCIALAPGLALAQSAPIPALAMGEALGRFAETYGWQLSYQADLVRNLTSRPIEGPLSGEAALRRLLEGSGLQMVVTGPNSAAITAAPQSGLEGDDGLIGVLRVAGSGHPSAGWDGSAETVFTTPGSVSAITTEQLETFRGTAPADLLRSAPGVISAEARNSGGLDVNIRGLQGPRVAVTVDGASNSTALYRGYQGVSNRSYIDPDFIAGVSVSPGPGTTPGAIGGTVAMRTYTVDDLVAPGERFGLRSRVELSGNVSQPGELGQPSLLSPSPQDGYGTTQGEVRPARGLGGLTSSLLMGYRGENFDLVLGYARRLTGNYHAGRNGSDAPQPTDCQWDAQTCAQYGGGYRFYTPGVTSFLPGEQVLNTSMANRSAMGRLNWAIAPDHTLSFGFSRYDSLHGETQPSWIWNNGQSVTQGPLSAVDLRSQNITYRWNPDSPLIDLRVNAWRTEMFADNYTANQSPSATEGRQWGLEIGNTSLFDLAGGEVVLQYGLTYGYESTRPAEGRYEPYPQRWGHRESNSIYLNGRWDVNDWLTVSAGLRNHGFSVSDDRIYTYPVTLSYGEREGRATDYSLAISAEALEGLRLFATYDEATRFPSIFEAVGGMAVNIDPNLRGERAHSFEFGANYIRDGLLTGSDSLEIKLTHFTNSVDDYIFRENRRYCAYEMNGRCIYWAPALTLSNLAQMNVQGTELQASYRSGSFTAAFSATYYNNIEFCPTRETCRTETIGADYATNQVPPEWSASLLLSQRFLDGALGVSARINHVGRRAIAAGATDSGAQPFIALVDWRPYTTIDVQADYQLGNGATIYAAIDNLADTYHTDPLSLALMPAPGRTIRIGLTAAIGGGNAPGQMPAAPATTDWSGFYAGVSHSGLQLSNLMRNVTTGDQTGLLAPAHGTVNGLRLGWNRNIGDGLLFGVTADAERGSIGTELVQSRGSTYFGISASDQMSLSARLGITTGNLLVYGALGIGSVDIRSTHRSYYNYGPNYGIYDMRYQNQGRRTGVITRVGAEYGLGASWSIYGEYQHMDFGSGHAWEDTQYDPVFDSEQTYGRIDQFSLDQFRLGVNYRF